MVHPSDIAIALVVAGLLTRWLALVLGALSERARASRTSLGAPEVWPPVDVIVPAKDEQAALASTVEAILASDYPSLRVIIVDDGSTDSTPLVAAALASANPRVQALRHPTNRGKAAALNTGLETASTELVITVDADTRPHPSCVRHLVRHLMDPSVSAVACNVKVDNRDTGLGLLQSLEYVAELGVDQRALAFADAITVVAGATGRVATHSRPTS